MKMGDGTDRRWVEEWIAVPSEGAYYFATVLFHRVSSRQSVPASTAAHNGDILGDCEYMCYRGPLFLFVCQCATVFVRAVSVLCTFGVKACSQGREREEMKGRKG